MDYLYNAKIKAKYLETKSGESKDATIRILNKARPFEKETFRKDLGEFNNDEILEIIKTCNKILCKKCKNNML